MNDLWRKVVGGSHHGSRFLNGVTQHFGNTEISDFYDSFFCQEDIGSFYVSMDNFPIVHMLHAEAHLSKPIQDLIFAKRPPSLLFDFLSNITAISIVHDDTELAFFSLEGLNKLDDVGMLHVLDNFGLLESFLFFALTHSSDVDDFHDAHEAVAHSLDEIGFSKRTFT